MSETELVKALAVTAECCGTEISVPVAKMMASDLSEYPLDAVLKALLKVRREHQGRLTLAAVISRIDDGRPGADEAWAQIPRDEYTTSVLTKEMMQALAVAQPLLNEGDQIAARMAFKDAYKKLVDEARTGRIPVSWSISIGWDKAGRVSELADAVIAGKIGQSAALHYLDGEHLSAFQKQIGGSVEAISAKPINALGIIGHKLSS